MNALLDENGETILTDLLLSILVDDSATASSSAAGVGFGGGGAVR